MSKRFSSSSSSSARNGSARNGSDRNGDVKRVRRTLDLSSPSTQRSTRATYHRNNYNVINSLYKPFSIFAPTFGEVSRQQHLIDNELQRRQFPAANSQELVECEKQSPEFVQAYKQALQELQDWLHLMCLRGSPYESKRDFLLYNEDEKKFVILDLHPDTRDKRRIFEATDSDSDNSDCDDDDIESDYDSSDDGDDGGDAHGDDLHNLQHEDLHLITLDDGASGSSSSTDQLNAAKRFKNDMLPHLYTQADALFKRHAPFDSYDVQDDIQRFSDMLNMYDISPPSLGYVASTRSWSYYFATCMLMCVKPEFAALYPDHCHNLFANIDECLVAGPCGIISDVQLQEIIQLLYLTATTTYNTVALKFLRTYLPFDCKY